MRVLDLFCGAGGAAMGYHLALEGAGVEHEIVGVDIARQPRYPFTFVQADAMEFRIRGGRTLGDRARDLVFTERYSNPIRPKYGFDAIGSGTGKGKGASVARERMGVEWMRGGEQSQAIPPAYTRYIGLCFLQAFQGGKG